MRRQRILLLLALILPVLLAVEVERKRWVLENGEWVWTGNYDRNGLHRDITDRVRDTAHKMQERSTGDETLQSIKVLLDKLRSGENIERSGQADRRPLKMPRSYLEMRQGHGQPGASENNRPPMSWDEAEFDTDDIPVVDRYLDYSGMDQDQEIDPGMEDEILPTVDQISGNMHSNEEENKYGSEELPNQTIQPNQTSLHRSTQSPVSDLVYQPATNDQPNRTKRIVGGKRPGPNAAASNTGGLAIWTFKGLAMPVWLRQKRSPRSAQDCCKKVLVTSSGPASTTQWDRMGVYIATAESLHGRKVYRHENGSQHIFYVYNEFDGWLLGPKPGVNFGGIKNHHDEMCVHDAPLEERDWSYYAGNTDTRDPAAAFPFWRQDDPSLVVRCVPRNVNIDSRRVSDPSRGPMLLNIYKKVRGHLVRHCGPPLSRKLNMEAWLVPVSCAGSCRLTNITLGLAYGEADLLVAVSTARGKDDLSIFCFTCAPHWAGRLRTGHEASLTQEVGARSFVVYVIIVGYSDYISLNVRVDSSNVLTANSELYTQQ